MRLAPLILLFFAHVASAADGRANWRIAVQSLQCQGTASSSWARASTIVAPMGPSRRPSSRSSMRQAALVVRSGNGPAAG